MSENISAGRKLIIDERDNPARHPAPVMTRSDDGGWRCRFEAMASPCEILVDVDDPGVGDAMVLAVSETWRIENKFSRYVSGNIIHRINTSNGETVTVDAETAHLLDYADTCFKLSGGKFDISSGPLRRVWRFDASGKIPSQQDIDAILPLVGWRKCHWDNPAIRLPVGAEIDLGGIGKEYAVDQSLQKVCEFLTGRNVECAPVLVNYGGDIACSGPRRGRQPWVIGIEKINRRLNSGVTSLKLYQGGVATSGDSHRYIDHGGRRYSHVLNPGTGWPVANAPATVTVHAASCTLAGMLATFAMLHGARAENFLRGQGVDYWLQRHPKKKRAKQ